MPEKLVKYNFFVFWDKNAWFYIVSLPFVPRDVSWGNRVLDVGQKTVKINIAERMAGVENMKEENDKKYWYNDEIQEEIYPAQRLR